MPWSLSRPTRPETQQHCPSTRCLWLLGAVHPSDQSIQHTEIVTEATLGREYNIGLLRRQYHTKSSVLSELKDALLNTAAPQ